MWNFRRTRPILAPNDHCIVHRRNRIDVCVALAYASQQWSIRASIGTSPSLTWESRLRRIAPHSLMLRYSRSPPLETLLIYVCSLTRGFGTNEVRRQQKHLQNHLQNQAPSMATASYSASLASQAIVEALALLQWHKDCLPFAADRLKSHVNQ